jgi:uncharacterized membrane protein YoaK (UPF0700 family)
MTLNAGILNVGAYLSVGVFVTHVTGFATLFGTELAIHNFEQAIFFLIVPFFFLLGSLISGLLVDRRIVHKQKPRYDIALSLAGVLILLIAILGHWNYLGYFTQRYLDHHLNVHGYFIILLTSLASGLQNAALTTSSGSIVRTTHLTGLTTDLGRELSCYLFNPRQERATHYRLRKSIILRFGLILFFTMGSMIGAVIFVWRQYDAFLIPALICFYSAFQLPLLAAHVTTQATTGHHKELPH